MITLRNHTGSVSKIGYSVILDPRDNHAFVYAPPSSSKVLGIITQSVSYRQPCQIATLGDKTRVFASGNVKKGDILRVAKTTDRTSLGVSVIAKTGDAPYLRIGEALVSGKGLIPCILDFTYSQTEESFNPDDYVPYIGATGDVDLGVHNITATDVIVSSLTSGRVVYVGALQELVDIAGFLFDGTRLTVSKILLDTGLTGAAASPALAFGDGDTGFYEALDDLLVFCAGGVPSYYIDILGFSGENTDKFRITKTVATATIPVFTFEGDMDTGIGKAGTDLLSLIAGGVENIRCSTTDTIMQRSIIYPYRAITAIRTLDSTDYQIECTGNTFIVTLPTAVGIEGRVYSIKNSGTGIITVDGNGAETIDAEITQILTQWDNMKIISNGTNWIII